MDHPLIDNLDLRNSTEIDDWDWPEFPKTWFAGAIYFKRSERFWPVIIIRKSPLYIKPGDDIEFSEYNAAQLTNEMYAKQVDLLFVNQYIDCKYGTLSMSRWQRFLRYFGLSPQTW